jgi:hypothetical protein
VVVAGVLPGVSILLVEVAAVLSGLEPGDVDGGENASEGVSVAVDVAVVVAAKDVAVAVVVVVVVVVAVAVASIALVPAELVSMLVGSTVLSVLADVDCVVFPVADADADAVVVASDVVVIVAA